MKEGLEIFWKGSRVSENVERGRFIRAEELMSDVRPKKEEARLAQALTHHANFYTTMRAGWNLRIGMTGVINIVDMILHVRPYCVTIL